MMAPPRGSDLGLPLPCLHSAPPWVRWGLGQLEDAPSLGFSKHFLEHPCATSRDPQAYPTRLARPLPRLCGSGGVEGRERLITAQESGPGLAPHLQGTGLPHRGQCEPGLRGRQFRGNTRWKAGVHELLLDGAVGVRALLSTLRNLCRRSSHHQPILGGSLSTSDRCSLQTPLGGVLPPVLCHSLLAPLPVSLEFSA